MSIFGLKCHRCEGFHRAGQLLAETKSMNSLLSMSSRYGLRTASRERPRAQATNSASILLDFARFRSISLDFGRFRSVFGRKIDVLDLWMAAQGSLASVSIKEASPKASPKAPKAPTEVVKHGTPSVFVASSTI